MPGGGARWRAPAGCGPLAGRGPGRIRVPIAPHSGALTAKSALVLGDYAVTTPCNFRDWSALRHGSYAVGPRAEGNRGRRRPGRACRGSAAAPARGTVRADRAPGA